MVIVSYYWLNNQFKLKHKNIEGRRPFLKLNSGFFRLFMLFGKLGENSTIYNFDYFSM